MTDEKQKEIPYFFLIGEDRTIGTPLGIASSDRTIDVQFQDLAENYDLQCKLNLGSAVFLKPAWSPPLGRALRGEELYSHVAGFMSSFSDNPAVREQRRDYLINNGLVRVLVTDAKQLEEVKVLVNALK